MKERYIVDTNVLIAASAGAPYREKDIDATPEDPAVREQVWRWLNEFQQGPSRMVLDKMSKIFEEYGKKVGFNDYGIQVVMSKWSTGAVDCVSVDYDNNGHGVLKKELADVVHDLDDRKMVAAAVASHKVYGEGCVAFAGDTDWHDWEDTLDKHDVLLEPIIEDWSRQKHREKQIR